MPTDLSELTPNLQIPLDGNPHDLAQIIDKLTTRRVDVDLSNGNVAPSRDDFRRCVILRFFAHAEAREIVLPGITKMVAVWNDGDFDVTLVANNQPIRILPRTAVWIFVTGSGDSVSLAPLGPAADTVTADTIPYDNPDYDTVGKALDHLLYVAPQITSFTNNRGTVEIGSTITSVHLSWAFNKAMTSVSLNHGIGAVNVDSTSYDVTGVSLTTDTSYTLTAGDGQNSVSASTSVVFRRKRYWGVSDQTSLDDSEILALGGSEFATNFNKSVSYNCTGGKYPYFCYPSSFGVPSSVTVGGLAFSDFTVTTQSFTNASGHTENYNVIRFNNIQTGSNIQVVWQ